MLPDRIVSRSRERAAIYAARRTIRDSSCLRASQEEIEKIVQDTVIHEIGHYFGFSDKELREIEAVKRKDMQNKR